MFGGQSSTPFGSGGGFGQQQTNTAPPFGSPAPAPGGLFGSPAPAPFGAPASGFGAPTFGAPASSAGGTGLFGQPAPAPAFGPSSTTFGPAPAPFGAPAPSGGLFGSGGSTTAPAPAFGSPAPAPGLFGAASTTASSPFGSTFGAPSTGYGSSGFGGSTMTTTTGAFGASQPSGGGLFGQPAPAPGAFGQPAPAPAFSASSTAFGQQPAPAPAFGSPMPSSGFGSTFGGSTASTGGGFLGGGQQQQQGGTRVAPYQLTNKQDGGTSINLSAISAMQQYHDRSFEELRFEDYSQGNRGSSTPTTSNTGAFFGPPAPAPAGGLFGGTPPAPAPFGAPAPGGYGAPAPAPFGAPAPGGFGAPAPAPFGAPAPAPFGAPAGGLFGSPTPAPAPFGAPAPSGGGLFGSTPAPSTFGAPAPAPFGAPAPAPFGAPAPVGGGLFGTSPAPAPFGAPVPAGGLFGSTPAPAPFGAAPASSGGLFGSAPAPAPFGAPAPSPGGLFGAAPAPGGFGFGAPAPAPTGGLFGSPAPAPAFGGFGSPAPAPFGAPATAPFGAPAAQPQVTGLPQNVQIIPPASNEVLAQQLRAMEQQKQELEKVKVWSGSTTKSASTTATSLPEANGLGLPGRSPYSLYASSSPRSGVKIRPRGFPKTEAPKPSTPLTAAVGRDNRGLMSPETHVRSSVMQLVIRPDSLKKKPKLRLKTDSPGATGQTSPSLPADTITPPPPDVAGAATQATTASPAPPAPMGTPTPSPQTTQGAATTTASPRSHPATSPGYDYYQKIIGSTEEGSGVSPTAASQMTRGTAASVPKLTKNGYEVSPSLESLSAMSEADLAAVPKFAVKRPGFGMVEWDGAVDVRGADLDRIVAIEPQDVSVYMLDEEEGSKPEVGSKLNRPSVITFYNVFSKSGPGADEEEKARFERKVERNTKRIGADLVSYDRNTGEWKIRVQHFSRYALLDDDTDESDTEPSPEKHVAFQADVEMKPKSLLRRKPTPFKKPRFHIDDDLDMSDSVGEDEPNVVSDVEMVDKDMQALVRKEADDAAAKLFAIVEDSRVPDAVPPKRAETLFFEEDDKDEDGDSIIDHVQPPGKKDTVLAMGYASICEKVLQESSLPSSAIDSSLLNGRSFRVGWSPNGSLLQLRGKMADASSILKRTRPVYSMDNPVADQESLLDNYISTAERVETGVNSCPIFLLPRSLQNGGSLQSHNNLYMSLKRFGNVELGNPDAEAAFLLLSSLLDVEDGDDLDALVTTEFHGASTGYSFSSRRNAAVLKWLKDLCSTDVDKDVKTAKAHNDMQSAVFAALSGGDVGNACELAAEAGMMNLAVVLSTDLEGRQDLLQQIVRLTEGRHSSKIRPETLRALEDLGGNLLSEENLFRKGASSLDWRRRLALRLLQEREEDLSSIIREYDEEVRSRVAPFPAPRYASGVEQPEGPSLLYRILSMVANAESSVSEVVCPDGFSSADHDFAVSFHLAAAISSMGIASLGPAEAESIRYGYESQLMSQGKWEWAVFVSLCSLGKDSVDGSRWKIMRAKDLVCRCFHEDPKAQQRRDFLEKHVGIPSAWFEEALAHRSAYNGNVFEYVLHALEFDPAAALDVLESTYLPNMFFMSTDEIDDLMEILAAAAPDEGSLALAIYRFFLLKKRFEALVDKEKDDIEEEIPELQENLQNIEQTLQSAKSRIPSHKIDVQLLPSLPKQVGLLSMVSEALEHLEFVKLQLSALEQGLPIVSHQHVKRRLAAMLEK